MNLHTNYGLAERRNQVFGGYIVTFPRLFWRGLLIPISLRFLLDLLKFLDYIDDI